MRLGKIVLVLLYLPQILYSQILFTAEIYREGSEPKELLFYYTNQEIIEGDEKTLTHLYTTPEGELFAKEEVKIVSGSFIQHNTDFYLLDEYSQLKQLEEGVEISFSRSDNSKKEVIPLSENLVFGPTQQGFIMSNLSLLKEGDKIIFQLPAPEFTTLTNFTIEKVDNTIYEKPGNIVLRMETKNFFLRLIVGKNYFVVDEKSGLILEIHGPSLLKVYERGKWRFVDVEIDFFYGES